MSMIQKKQNNRRRSRKKDRLKNVTHEQISAALAEFLERGGVIHRIEQTERSFEEFLANNSGGLGDVDDFLIGSGA